MQTVSTDLWEIILPDGWEQTDRELAGTVYLESPEGTEGVYLSAWRVSGQRLIDAMRDARTIEQRNLPGFDEGEWMVLGSSEADHGAGWEVVTEYHHPIRNYRIVSRMLGRGDAYARVSYHDYDCTDVEESSRRSTPVIASLVLHDGERE